MQRVYQAHSKCLFCICEATGGLHTGAHHLLLFNLGGGLAQVISKAASYMFRTAIDSVEGESH